MKIRKKYLALVMSLILLFVQMVPVYAENCVEDEWYELVEEEFEIPGTDVGEITPYTQYIIDVMTFLANLGNGKVGMRASVYCASTVKNVTVTFYLQKKSGSSWVTVGSTSVSASNVSSTSKSVTASGVSSGTYRAKTVTRVTDKYGYSETVTGYSGSLNI